MIKGPFIFFLGSILALLGCKKNNSDSWGTPESQIQSSITNIVTGYYRTVRIDIHTNGSDPKLWTAEADVEHYNKVGGIERETIPFICDEGEVWTADAEKWLGITNVPAKQ